MDPWESDDFLISDYEVDDDSDTTEEEDEEEEEEDEKEETDDFDETPDKDDEREKIIGCPQDKYTNCSKSNAQGKSGNHIVEQLKISGGQASSSFDRSGVYTDVKENKRRHECQTAESGLRKRHKRDSQEMPAAEVVHTVSSVEEEITTQRDLHEMLPNTSKQLVDRPVTEDTEQLDHLQIQETIAMTGGMAKDSIVIGANYGKVELRNEGIDLMRQKTKMIINQSKLRLISDFDERLFVRTKAIDQCEQHLLHRGMVTIIGRSGEGKTTASLYFLKTLSEKESRKPLILTEPSQWDHIPSHHQLRNPEKYIVLVDDVFGRSNLVQHLQTQWEQKLPMMMPLVEAGVVLLIMVFRTNIFLLCRDYLRQYELFQCCPVVELSTSGEHNEGERQAILENHINTFAKELTLSAQNKMEIIHSSQVLGFPQCCKLFAKSIEMHSKGSVFFTKPLVYLSQCLESLSKKDSLSNLVLLLILFYDGRLPLKVLDQFERSTKDKEILEDLIQVCVTPDSQKPTLGDILSKAHSLCGSYLTWEGDQETFSFLHHSVSDTIFLQFCRTYLAKGIQICSVQTLLEYIRTVDNNEDWIVVVPNNKFSVLAERLTRELLSDNCFMVLTHSVFKDARFRKFLTTIYLDSDVKKRLVLQVTKSHSVSATLYFCKYAIAVLGDNDATNLLRLFTNPQTLVAFVSNSFLTLSVLSGVEKLAMTLLPTARQVLSAEDFSVVMENLLACAFYKRSKHLLSQLMEEGASLSIKCFVAICLSPEVDTGLFDLAFDFMKDCDSYIGVLQDMLHFTIEHGRFLYFEKLVHLIRKKVHGLAILEKACFQILLMFHNATPRWFLTWNEEKMKHFGIANAISVLHNLGVDCSSEECVLLAAGCHDKLAFKTVLQCGGNSKCKTESQQTALHFAALFGSVDTLELLLHQTDAADIDAEDVDGFTPLHFAAKSLMQSSEKIDSLICKGSNAGARTKTGKSALTLAIKAGNIGSVASLLQASDKEFTDKDFPVHIAMSEIIQSTSENWSCDFQRLFMEKRLHLIEVLLNYGYSLSDKNNANLTPLHLAVMAGNVALLEHFLNRVSANDLPSLLHHSITHSRLGIVKLLLCKCSDAAMNENGDSPLHTAVNTLQENDRPQSGTKKGNKVDVTRYSVFEYLLEHGADTNVVNRTGTTPLHTAAMVDDPEVVVRLIRKGADIDVPNSKHDTALIIASVNGHVKLARCLVENGADVNVKGENGDTPLHAATRGGHISLVKYITKRFADFSAINNNGETCFEIAVKHFCNTTAKNKHLKSRASLVSETNHGKILKYFLDKRSDIKPSDRNTEILLLCAVENGLTDLVKSLLKKNVDVNARDKLNRTPLYIASERGNAEMVEYLVKKGADKIAEDDAGDTPLHAASRGGHLVVVKYLIGIGTDLSVTNKHGETFLVSAAHHFCDMLVNEDSASATDQLSEVFALIRSLLNEGIDMNLANRYGDIFLHYAAENGIGDIVKGLVQKGADVNNTDSRNRMPLHKASSKGHVEIVKYLVENGADSSARDGHGKTALDYGITHCLTDIIKVVMDNKYYTWHTVYPFIRPLLYYSAFHGHLQLVEYLVEKGSKISSVAHQSRSRALSAASYCGHIEIVKVLVDRGSEVNAMVRSASSQTPSTSVLDRFLSNTDSNMPGPNKSEVPVHTALQSMHAEIVQYLAMKASLFRTLSQCSGNAKGITKIQNYLVDLYSVQVPRSCSQRQSLHVATKETIVEIVRYLVETGENIENSGILHRSPLCNAADNGHTEIIKYLLGKGADLSTVEISRKTPLQSAAENGQMTAARCLVENGADVEAADALQRRPLHHAASEGHAEIVKFLVENGADLEVSDLMQRTPLHIAAEKGHVEVVRFLTETGADLEAADGLERRSLHSAARQGHNEVVKILVEKGADVDATDCEQKTPLQIAQEKDQSEVIRYLTPR